VPNYLADDAEFCSLSPFSEAQAAELAVTRPGHLMALATALSAGIDARLTKRGDVPFTSPYPLKVKMWVADLLTPRAYTALGVRPTDEQQVAITETASLANEEIKEAADPVKGLLLLPLQSGAAAQSQANESPTLAYSEQSPFTAKHQQWALSEIERENA
jgi:hypothetical protein